MTDQPQEWPDRIVDLVWVDPKDLIPHPKNWRVHTPEQIAAYAESVREVGITDVPKRSIRSQYIVDGHMRVDWAIQQGIERIQVLDLDLTEQQELQMVATHDPIGDLAEPMLDRLTALHAETTWDDAPALDAAIARMLTQTPRLDPVIITREDHDPAPAEPVVSKTTIDLTFREQQHIVYATALDLALHNLPDQSSDVDALMAICADALPES